MSNPHFTQWAKHVVEQLFQDRSAIEVFTWDEEGIARLQHIIAEAGEVLVNHAFRSIDLMSWDAYEQSPIEVLADDIPDIAEWPAQE